MPRYLPLSSNLTEVIIIYSLNSLRPGLFPGAPRGPIPAETVGNWVSSTWYKLCKRVSLLLELGLGTWLAQLEENVDFWPQGREFEPRLGCRDYLNKQNKTQQKPNGFKKKNLG